MACELSDASLLRQIEMHSLSTFCRVTGIRTSEFPEKLPRLPAGCNHDILLLQVVPTLILIVSPPSLSLSRRQRCSIRAHNIPRLDRAQVRPY